MSQENVVQIKVWDLPTRAFHWSLPILLGACWWTSTEDGDMDTHMLCGYALLSLLAFRLSWGMWGSETSRFRHFVRGPSAVYAYLSGKVAHTIGHNPAGGWMVLALLSNLVAVTVTGLFARDDMESEGPLSHLLAGSWSDRLTGLHEQSFYLLLVLSALHLFAVLFYLILKHENLVGPMLSGRKSVKARQIPQTMKQVGALRAVLSLLVCVLAVWAIVHYGHAPAAMHNEGY
jgi:cytochrome b